MLKVSKFSAATDSNGALVLQVKVPGNFAGIDSSQPTFQGLEVKSAKVWLANPVEGDFIGSITLRDLDGLIPVNQRAAFPSYPIIKTSDPDGVSAQNQGLYINPNEPFEFNPSLQANLLPSGLYLVIVIQKATAVVDTAYANILFDDRSK